MTDEVYVLRKQGKNGKFKTDYLKVTDQVLKIVFKGIWDEPKNGFSAS